MDNLLDTIAGLKLWSAIAAWLGSAISLSYMPQLSTTKMLATLASGGIIAMYAARGIRLIRPDWPDGLETIVSFFVGLLAMPLMPAAIEKAKSVIAGFKVPGSGG